MGKGIQNKIGPYMYADGALFEKAFAGGRDFKIVIAGAFNAGIIGSEHNGIVVLDETYSNVVLDQHVREDSGYFGPSARQMAEAERIMAMDWAEFSKFCREHPRYRQGSMPDAFQAEPNRVKPEEDRIIFPASAKDRKCPYEMPLESRREIIDFLISHQMHRIDGSYSNWAIAWNIKVGLFDTSGKHQDDVKVDPQFDERWESYVQANGEMFYEEAADALSQYLDGTYCTYNGDDEGAYKFNVTGRSGGWLVLTEMDGTRLEWDSQGAMKEGLKEMDDADLVKLYTVVAHVDKDVANPSAVMSERYAYRRQMKEEEWAEEMISKPKF